MDILIDGKKYDYISNAIQNDDVRESYFNLIQKAFNLNFRPWYQSGYCNEAFIPYTLFDGDAAVSSVGVVICNFKWQNTDRNYIQISTVITDPDYRGRGLSRWLMENALKEWKDKCDAMYLYANDSVVDFYPMFGFKPAYEYRYSMPVEKKAGTFRKLDLSIQSDIDLLIRKHKQSNPFSSLVMNENIEIMMFHCISFLSNNIYYIEQYNAIVIAEYENDDIFCYDIYTDTDCNISELLGIISLDNTKNAVLGFTPNTTADYEFEQAMEDNTTLFVLDGKENILKDNKVTFPFLSRA